MIVRGMGQTDIFRYGKQGAGQTDTRLGRTGTLRDGRTEGNTDLEAARSIAQKKRMISRDGEDDRNKTGFQSNAESAFSYSESLRKARENKKATQLKLKKLRYSYKSISSQLLNCKTSSDAARVARKARRELISLKGKRMHESQRYDSNELEAAIAHAEAMVRVARKKVKHLQEEELSKVKGGLCAGELEEKKEEDNQRAEEEKDLVERIAGGGNGGSGQGDSRAFLSQGDLLEARQERQQTYEEEMRKAMSDLMEEMSDAFRELTEEFGPDELVKVETDPADYKMMKLKHRLEEMKAIAKADAEYLRAVFNKLERERASAAQNLSGLGQNNAPGAVSSGGMVIAANSGGAPRAIDVVSAPGDAASAVSAPAEGGIVDVSV